MFQERISEERHPQQVLTPSDGTQPRRVYRLLFTCDASVYGGHEAQFIKALLEIARDKDWKLLFAFSSSNAILQARCAELIHGGVLAQDEVIAFRYSTGRASTITAPLRYSARAEFRRILERFQPDAVIAIQGRIEASNVGLYETFRANIPVYSYIPFAHPLHQVAKTKWLISLREFVNRQYYRRIRGYLVPSTFSANQLESHGAGTSVAVVENSVDPPATVLKREEACEILDVSPNVRWMVCVGRIEFSQKGQDRLVRAWKRVSVTRGDLGLLVVGGGPDMRSLRVIVEHLRLQEHVVLREWQSNREAIYGVADAILLPSRFEGVPLVLLEAALLDVPVLCQPLDELKIYVPAALRVDYDDPEALRVALGDLRSESVKRALAQLRAQVSQVNMAGPFGKRFNSALKRLLDISTCCHRSAGLPETAAH